MAFSLTVPDVRQLAGVPAGTFDTQIQFMIDTCAGPLYGIIDPKHLSDGYSCQLINLAAMEIVAGEFISWLYRQPGYADRIHIGTLEIQPLVSKNLADPSGLKSQGIRRMRGYLRIGTRLPMPAEVGTSGGKRGEQ